MQRRRAQLIPLAGGVLIAGIVVFAKTSGSDPATPPASIAGPSLVRPDHVVPPPAPKPVLELQLDKLARNGDHYEAPLADGRIATLTLDPQLQEAAEKLLVEARAPRGAIVAMAPDGRILALAGRRTVEPKGGKDGTSDWHLATDVWAPAASIFKLVTASALVAGGLDPDEKVAYHGGLRSIVESNLKDDRRDNNTASLTFGVAHSNNAIVGKLAYQHLVPSALESAAHDLGLAAPLPASLALTGAIAELALPHDKSLEFARASAGFSGSRLSVLGGALLAVVFADRGEQPSPHIIASIAGAPQTTEAPHRAIAENVAVAVSKMMIATCDFGSAARSFHHHAIVASQAGPVPIVVAGKTGTLTTTEPFYMENSWFVGYAPADQPQIIVSVLLGNPENWHLRGHEAAKRLIDLAIGRPPDHAAARSAPQASGSVR